MVRFREVQRFRQPWLWAILIPAFLSLVPTFGYGMARQLLYGVPWGKNPMSDTALAIVGPLAILLGFLLVLLMATTKLITEVRGEGLYIRFFPFLRREIPFRDILRFEVRTYRPVRDFGGWGIRYASGGRGKAYTVSGRRGVQLEFTDGRRLLIGSRRPEELHLALRAGMGEAP